METKILKLVFDRESQIDSLNKLFNYFAKNSTFSHKIIFKRNKGVKRSMIAYSSNNSIFGEDASKLNRIQVDFIFGDELAQKNNQDFDYIMLSSEHNCGYKNIESKIIHMFFNKNLVLGILTRDFELEIHEDPIKVSELFNKVLNLNNYIFTTIGVDKNSVIEVMKRFTEGAIVRSKNEIEKNNDRIILLKENIIKYEKILL